MPFGKYADFADCVSKNQDKESPEGYCAEVHKKITGKYPSEHSGLHADLVFSDSPRRRVVGVEIFKSGEHVDSLGRLRIWTPQELSKIVANFQLGFPKIASLKLGHSSPEHNANVARELGVVAAILQGENGVGAATLGQVAGLQFRDGVLIADLETPESVADLIRRNFFTGVSSEIIEDYQGKGPVLSGLALLGAERSALKDLKGLAGVTILDDGTKPDRVYVSEFQASPELSIRPQHESRKSLSHVAEFQWRSVDALWEAVSRLLGHEPDESDLDRLWKGGVINTLESAMLQNRIDDANAKMRAFITEFPEHFQEAADWMFQHVIAEDIYQVPGRGQQTYSVPVTEEKVVNGRVVERQVRVTHVRADNPNSAKNAVIRGLESIATEFGRVVARGAGALTVLIAQDTLRRWVLGEPSLVKEAAAAKVYKPEPGHRRRMPWIVRKLGGFQEAADGVYRYSLSKIGIDLLESLAARSIAISNSVRMGHIDIDDGLHEIGLIHRQIQGRIPLTEEGQDLLHAILDTLSRLTSERDFLKSQAKEPIGKEETAKLLGSRSVGRGGIMAFPRITKTGEEGLEGFRGRHLNFADQLYTYSLLGTGLLILGSYAAGKTLWNFVVSRLDKGAEEISQGQAWANSEKEAKHLVSRSLPDWGLVSLALALSIPSKEFLQKSTFADSLLAYQPTAPKDRGLLCREGLFADQLFAYHETGKKHGHKKSTAAKVAAGALVASAIADFIPAPVYISAGRKLLQVSRIAKLTGGIRRRIARTRVQASRDIYNIRRTRAGRRRPGYKGPFSEEANLALQFIGPTLSQVTPVAGVERAKKKAKKSKKRKVAVGYK